MDVLFHRDFTGRALIAQGNGLILPLLEIGFPDLLDPHSGSVVLGIFVGNLYTLSWHTLGYLSTICKSHLTRIASHIML